MITLTGPLKMWTNDEGRMHFMSVPEEISGEIRAHAMLVRRGFGSAKVQVTIDHVSWNTSVFPSKNSGGYFLPVKSEICRKARIAEGDEVTLRLELL